MINHLVVNDRIYCCIFTLYADAQQVLYRVQKCKFSHSRYISLYDVYIIR